MGNGGVNEGARGFLYVCVFEGGFDLPCTHPCRSEPQRSGQLPVGVAQETAAPATSVGALLAGNDVKHSVAWRDGRARRSCWELTAQPVPGRVFGLEVLFLVPSLSILGPWAPRSGAGSSELQEQGAPAAWRRLAGKHQALGSCQQREFSLGGFRAQSAHVCPQKNTAAFPGAV